MEYRKLGQTGIKVSRMCFGVLTVGPMQANLPVTQGAEIIRYALERGVNFMDTAQCYGTYPYIRQALKGYNGEVVIASKSYAYTREMMMQAVEEARRELDRDIVDLFLLHEQESALTIKGHWEAFEYLMECRQKGLIKAAGISTHTVAAVRAAAVLAEIDVIHPLYNINGVGIIGGTVGEMGEAIAEAARAGKGIYGMKSLGGGNLLAHVDKALAFVLGNENLHAIAVGMQSREEVDMNVRLFSGEAVPDALRRKIGSVPRSLLIEPWCQGCGKCVERCRAGALSLKDGKAEVDRDICCLCGYCGPACTDFCIKVI